MAQTPRSTNTNHPSRRLILAGAEALTLPGAAISRTAEPRPTKEIQMPDAVWPNGARLAVSFSLMFEAGGQPISGAGGVIPDPIQQGIPDLPTNAFFEYGAGTPVLTRDPPTVSG